MFIAARSIALRRPRLESPPLARCSTPATASRFILIRGIAYPDAERDYLLLIDELLDSIAPKDVSFVSIGGLRMTPTLRTAARARFPHDAMLCTEDVLAPDGRFRTFTPLRLKLYRTLAERFRLASSEIPAYLCMEPPSVHERVFGATAPRPATIGERLARS